MTREERAKAYSNVALKPYGDVSIVGLFVSDIVEIARQAYLTGAKDEESNPAWRMCEEELPEEDGWYLVVVDGEVYTSYYCAASAFSKFKRGCVSHWLPFPKFNPESK